MAITAEYRVEPLGYNLLWALMECILTAGEPIYHIAKIERGCASEELEKQCISTPLDNTGVEYVSCQETCQTTGCNVGWRKEILKYQF